MGLMCGSGERYDAWPVTVLRRFAMHTRLAASIVALAFFALVGPDSNPAIGDETTKPNIVLVFMDNFGWGEPGFNGGGIIRGAATPRMDKLAAEATVHGQKAGSVGRRG